MQPPHPSRPSLLCGIILCGITWVLFVSACSAPAPSLPEARTVPGYRGIWFDLGQRSTYGSKYSGGLGTYTAKHHPLAVYAPDVDRTFFVYGGTTSADERHLLAMIGYFDHTRAVVPRPVVVHDKEGVDDPHDNPSLSIDGDGTLWVFVSGRGRHRPGYKYRSLKPFDINGFELVSEEEFTYPQPWWVEGRGFVLLFTRYTAGRELYWHTSSDGRAWSPARKLAGMGGHYQMSNEREGRVVTAFNMHPEGNVDRRTNLYFLQTDDMGRTWRTVEGTLVEPPLTDPDHAALVRDYRSEERLVYLKDVGFDDAGRPVLLYITSGSHEPGPGGDPRTWTIAHWGGSAWAFHEIAPASHNYDMGSLYVEDDGAWRIIAPTAVGPQPYGTGGEMQMWLSRDQGATWTKTRDLTRGSPYNHAYARRPLHADPDFYAFWADGNPDSLSPSRLYFTDREGTQVWRLPYHMEATDTAPEALPVPATPDP